jgi:hypothetical protein
MVFLCVCLHGRYLAAHMDLEVRDKPEDQLWAGFAVVVIILQVPDTTDCPDPV